MSPATIVVYQVYTKGSIVLDMILLLYIHLANNWEIETPAQLLGF